jgi:quinol monooxygenase YgiN
MIVEYIRYEVPQGQGPALESAYQIAAQSLQASSHCLGYELSRCTESDETLVLRILWDSAEGHMQGFRKSAEFGSFFKAIQPFVPHIKEMRHYQATSVRWAR